MPRARKVLAVVATVVTGLGVLLGRRLRAVPRHHRGRHARRVARLAVKLLVVGVGALRVMQLLGLVSGQRATAARRPRVARRRSSSRCTPLWLMNAVDSFTYVLLRSDLPVVRCFFGEPHVPALLGGSVVLAAACLGFRSRASALEARRDPL